MPTPRIFVGDFGTKILVNLVQKKQPLDVSAATTVTLELHRPEGGAVTTHTMSFETDGTDGKVFYVTVPGDIDVAGKWVACVTAIGPGFSRTSAKFIIDIGEC